MEKLEEKRVGEILLKDIKLGSVEYVYKKDNNKKF